ncbi:TetR/AcrR family transcriptional regulator [Amycolatopsis vancoresmycina]|uniref:Transcriptional regulator, TetR family protein n=1 Tax=Amycolatopsis vancoresmycina DSM 44592 TaxID=1292037 RepID=R1G1I6_9PSEU|nr:TetR/AcrR family transcriptional regulator [Amycolatopsis vancoresmycina]EOD65393.1 transcriptional regulator, TetR family protein [Amycolatopsis vancoresmycina DSM 44592]
MSVRPLDPTRDARILDAVLELLAEAGYVSMTIDAVAARSGTSKATIYRRWRNKREITVAAMARYHGTQTEWTVDTGTFRGDLLAHTRRFADVLTGFDGRLAVGLVQARAADPELVDELEARFSSGARLPAEAVGRAVERGELPGPADAGLFEEVVASVMFMRWLWRLPLDEGFAEHVVDDLAMPVLRANAGRAVEE